MTIRKLPEIKAFDQLAGLEWTPPEETLAHWDDRVSAAAASEADDVISLYGIVGRDMLTGEDNSERRISAALRRIGKRDVTVNVNSPGGNYFSGMAIYNLLRDHPAKVTVKVMGLAGSAASLVAMAGDEVLIAKSAHIMVHNASGVVFGNRHDMRAAATLLDEIDTAMAGVYAARSGKSEEQAAAWMDHNKGDGTYFRGADAIAAGLADALLPADAVKADEGRQKLKATARVEQALIAQGMSRAERRSLIGEINGGPAVAGSERPAVAGDLNAEILRLIDTIRPAAG